jgi:hypothetical protein
VLRIELFRPAPGDRDPAARECACCGARYAVRRRAMRLISGASLEGDVCPECVLLGPSGAAAKVRERLAASCAAGGERDPSLFRLLSLRARLLEELESFPLAIRQAAVRETRERR